MRLPPFYMLEWINLPWTFVNITEPITSLNIQGYGLSVLMLLTYGIVFAITVCFCLTLNRGGFCCVLHIKNNKLRNADESNFESEHIVKANNLMTN